VLCAGFLYSKKFAPAVAVGATGLIIMLAYRKASVPRGWRKGMAMVIVGSVLSMFFWIMIAGSADILPSNFPSALIFCMFEGILISVMSVFSQAIVPGIGGILASCIAFFAGSIKGYLIADTGPGLVDRILEIALLPIPNFQTITAYAQVESGFSLSFLFEVSIYVVLFSAGAVAAASAVYSSGKSEAARR
jgi:hypothetical protein